MLSSKARNFAPDPIKSGVVIVILLCNSSCFASSCYPLTDVRCAIQQGDGTRLAPCEKIDSILTNECHILQVADDRPLPAFRRDQSFKFRYVFLTHPTAQHEDHVAICRSVYSQHPISSR